MPHKAPLNLTLSCSKLTSCLIARARKPSHLGYFVPAERSWASLPQVDTPSPCNETNQPKEPVQLLVGQLGLSVNVNGNRRATGTSTHPRLPVSPTASDSWKLFGLSIAKGEELKILTLDQISLVGQKCSCPPRAPNHPDEGVSHLNRHDGLLPQKKASSSLPVMQG